MKIFFLIAIAILSVLIPCASYSQSALVSLRDVQLEYKSLGDVEPTLVNDSNQSIYLLPDTCGEAKLWHLTRDSWIQGASPKCPVNHVAIEIKPGEGYRIPCLIWRLKDPSGTSIAAKDAVGRFKITVPYSLTPIIRSQTGKPQLKPMKQAKQIMTVSAEFSVVP